MTRFKGFGRLAGWLGGSKAKSIALGGLVGLLSVLPSRSDADLISVGNLSGSVVVGSSEMFLRHEVGGSLDHDSGDGYWFAVLSPPGMGSNDDWLRIYSDQVNQIRNRDDREMMTDNRPFSDIPEEEEYTNQNFPLIFDTRYGDNEPSPAPISSANNFIRFELQSGIDEGREFYQWTMTLDAAAGASFTDGTQTKSGTWDLAATGGQGGTYDLPSYNLVNTQGQYGTLDVLPIPEPSSILLLAFAGGALAWRRKRMNPRSGRRD